MLLFPRKSKYKKYHKQKRRLISNFSENNYIYPKSFFYGIKLLSKFRVFDYHLETIKIFIKKKIKKKSKKKLIFGMFPDLPITKKSSGLRMGKGKGNVVAWTSMVFAGRIFCEFQKISSFIDVLFLTRKISKKLSSSVKLVIKKKFYNY